MSCNISQIILASRWVDFFAIAENLLSCNRFPLQYQRSDCDVDLEFLKYAQIYVLLRFRIKGSSFSFELYFA